MECNSSPILTKTKTHHKMKNILLLAGTLALFSFAADKFISMRIESLQKDMARTARLDSVVAAPAPAAAPAKKK